MKDWIDKFKVTHDGIYLTDLDQVTSFTEDTTEHELDVSRDKDLCYFTVKKTGDMKITQVFSVDEKVLVSEFNEGFGGV